MSDEMEALARRAVACKGWRWMGGSQPLELDDGEWCARARVDFGYPETGHVPDGCVPDMTDPATLGCLLALVRKACGAQVWAAPSDDGGWSVMAAIYVQGCRATVAMAIGDTYAAALVAALEAAP